MTEILNFPIRKAYAEMTGSGLVVTLHYPATRQTFSERKLTKDDPAILEHGIACLEALQQGTRVRIGTEQFPSRPASGSIIDIVGSGNVWTHRRDGGTKVHPWYHGIASGFPSTSAHFNNLVALQRKEAGEEHLLFTADGTPHVYVPEDEEGRAATEERLTLLGLENQRLVAPIEYAQGPDTLIIMDHAGAEVARYRGSIYLSWEQEANVAIAGFRHWNVEPGNIRGVDAEGMVKQGGQFIHFGREMFYFTREQLAQLAYGDVLEDPTVYMLDRRGSIGIPIPRQGPAMHKDEPIPDLFKPDDGLRRMLDTMGIAGYRGKWIEHELKQSYDMLRLLRGE